MGDTKRHVGRAGERRTTWTGGERERMDGLRGKGSSGVCNHEGLEYRRTRPWILVQHNMRRGLQVYVRMGEGIGKGVPKLAEEERKRRGEQD